METVQLKKKTGEDVVPVTAEPPQAFIDMWEEACGTKGKYNPDTKYFELNGYIDITYKEALLIYHTSSSNRTHVDDRSYQYEACDCRTLLPFMSGSLQGFIANIMFYNSKVKRISADYGAYTGFGLLGIYPREERSMFQNSQIESIDGINLKAWANKAVEATMFGGCKALQDINFIEFNVSSISFKDSPLLSYSTFQSMLKAHVLNYSTTVTVHADIYKALTGGAEYPFNGGSREQWEALMSEAIGKQIAFVSA